MPAYKDLSKMFEDGAERSKTDKFCAPHQVWHYDKHPVLVVSRDQARKPKRGNDYSLSKNSIERFARSFELHHVEKGWEKPYVLFADAERVSVDGVAKRRHIPVFWKSLLAVQELISEHDANEGRDDRGPFWWISKKFEVVTWNTASEDDEIGVL